VLLLLQCLPLPLPPVHPACLSRVPAGFSLERLLELTQREPVTLLFVLSEHNNLFGAFLTRAWAQRLEGRWFGDGDSFLFSLRPKFKVYRWVGVSAADVGQRAAADAGTSSNRFQRADSKHLYVGGGSGGMGLSLAGDFSCTSSVSETFANVPLNGEHELFRAKEVEVYGLSGDRM